MSCPICHRSSCTLSFHSLEEQDRYEARKEMSDDVDTLRRELQEAREELAEAKERIIELNDRLSEMLS